jgi:hypothetical protein
MDVLEEMSKDQGTQEQGWRKAPVERQLAQGWTGFALARSGTVSAAEFQYPAQLPHSRQPL